MGSGVGGAAAFQQKQNIRNEALALAQSANATPTPGFAAFTPLQAGGKASDMAASVLQAEMAQWESQYKPVELNLLGQSSLQDPSVLDNAVNQATTTAQGVNSTMQGVAGRQMASRGITATPQQKMVMDRLQNLSGAANVAGGINQARQNVATQDELISFGTAPNPNIVQQSANAKY